MDRSDDLLARLRQWSEKPNEGDAVVDAMIDDIALAADRIADLEAKAQASPKRRRLEALSWIGDHEPVALFDVQVLSLKDVQQFAKEGDVEECGREPDQGGMALTLYRLTDQGRAKLGPEPVPDIGRMAVDHLRSAYPDALAAVPKNAAVSLRNFVNNRVRSYLEKGKAR